ncbi:MAG: LysR substrate-binding domain-containing protein [Polyangiaceae bacterium]
MDSRLLDAFLAVVQSQSYSQAARQLGLPKSTVSRYVTELERSLGVRLLHRTTRKLNLTSSGQVFYERVEPLMRELRLALTETPERDGAASGTLRVTTSVDFGISVLAPLVTEFLRAYPQVSVDLRLTNEYVDLVKDGLDLAIRMASRRLSDSTLQARKIGHLNLVLVASRRYLEEAGTPRSPKDLEAHQWVRFRGMDTLRLTGPSGSVKLMPQGRVTVDDMIAAREAVRSGAGLALLPMITLHGQLDDGELVRILPKWQVPSTDVWFIWPTASYVPRKVTVFTEFLTTRLKQFELLA